MGNYLAFPLVQQGRQEEAAPGTFGAAIPTMFLPELKNYAAVEKVRQYYETELYPIMEQTRIDRQDLEAEWESIRNMVMMRHDAGRRYFGRSDTYMPVYKRERKKLISMLSVGLFPSDDYFDVVDRSTGDPERARLVKVYTQWELEKNARVRASMKPTLASLVDYGTAVRKTWYRKELLVQGGIQRQISVGAYRQNEYGFSQVSKEGWASSPRNLLYWYIYPQTCESLDDAQMIFEDIDVPHSFLKWMKDLGRWENVDEVVAQWTNEYHDRQMQELLTARGFGGKIPGRDLGEAGRIYTFTEMWTYMVLPPDAYLPWEDDRYPIPVRIVAINNIPVEIRRNPFFHQRPPYEVARIDWEAGLFYGNAEGRLIRPLQLLANDFVNQTNDNGILAMNPITILNPNMLIGPPRPFAPGIPWYANNVNEAVRFERPPWEQAQVGHMLSQFIIGMAQDMGGAPPDRSTMSKGAKTATGMQILQRNAIVPLQDVVQDVEVDMMVPMLEKAFINSVQYREAAVMAQVAGQAIEVTPEDLAIDAGFDWKASSQAVNSQIRSQQAMSLIQSVTPLVPLIMQQGYVVDFVPLIQKVYTDGFGFRNFREFIRRAEAMGSMPGMPLPEQMNGIRREQGDRLRSALEQIHGAGGAEAVPGEAEDFNEVRNVADGLAGMIGGMDGGVLQ